MKNRKNRIRLLAVVLALVFLTGCGTAASAATNPQEKQDDPAETIPEEAISTEAVRVTNVDELLAAIAPDTTILLEAGEYDLSTAANYGSRSDSPYYDWEEVWGEEPDIHAELVVSNVKGLVLLGEGMGKTTISAVPRYANVIHFRSCRDLTVGELTAGHTTAPGFCSGGVLYFENCSNVTVDSCGLYGCGTVGVDAMDTSDLHVIGCSIYECSYNAVNVFRCRNVRVEGCDIFNHGTRPELGSALSLLAASYSDGFTLYNNSIHDNEAQYILNCSYTKNTLFFSNEVTNNTVASAVFCFEAYGAVVDGCSFTDNHLLGGWHLGTGVFASDINGNLLDGNALEAMTLRDIDPGTVVKQAKMEAPTEVEAGGTVEVTTIDEFLSAIGPDRIIVLNGDLFDLSTAANYGSIGGEYYFWQDSYDGPELVIHDVHGMIIQSASEEPVSTVLSATPRYANVLNLRYCEDVTLAGFTAGHTKEPGSCAGGVVNLENCGNIRIEEMRLYGCGILGIQASECTDITVQNTEIYECSQGACNFWDTTGIRFNNCDVHDVPSPAFSFSQCWDMTWNDMPVFVGWYDVGTDGKLVKNEYADNWYGDEAFFYDDSVEGLENPFSGEPAHFYPAGSPQAAFTAAVQQAVIDGDWEALADRISFPIQIYSGAYNCVINDREEFMAAIGDEDFMNSFFNDVFRQRIADASLEEYGSCLFGDTCLDHLIAFSCFGYQVTEDNLFITAISATTPLWHGNNG